jgi:hypothetical protein
MKEMIERICSKRIVFSSLETIDPKMLQTRKKVDIFSAIDLKSYYHLIFRIEQKSRFVMRQVEEILALALKAETHQGHCYRHKHVMIKAPLCSKAKAALEREGWKVYYDIV